MKAIGYLTDQGYLYCRACGDERAVMVRLQAVYVDSGRNRDLCDGCKKELRGHTQLLAENCADCGMELKGEDRDEITCGTCYMRVRRQEDREQRAAWATTARELGRGVL